MVDEVGATTENVVVLERVGLLLLVWIEDEEEVVAVEVGMTVEDDVVGDSVDLMLLV